MLQGYVIAEGNRDYLPASEHRLVVGLGVKNLVVVETDDAVLIADRSKAQEIKSVVQQLEAASGQEAKPTARSIAHGAITRLSPKKPGR